MAEKHIEHGKKPFHNCIDCIKAFDRIWHNGIWNIMINNII